MPSKLTQAEKHRRAGIKEALRVLNQQARKAAYLIEVIALEDAKLAVRALLAPKRKTKRSKHAR